MFNGANFHPNISFEETKFNDTSSSHSTTSYRSLKLLCKDISFTQEEELFYGLENESRLNSYSFKQENKNSSYISFMEILFLYFYKYSSDYGKDLGLIVFWIIMLFLYMTSFNCFFIDTLNSFSETALFTLKTTLKPFNFLFDSTIKLSPIVSVVNIFYTIVSAVLLVLLGTSTRRKFKLK